MGAVLELTRALAATLFQPINVPPLGGQNLPNAYTTGRYYESGISLGHGLGSTGVMTENRLAASAIFVPKTTTFDRIGLNVTSGFGAAQGQIKLGIYRIGTTGLNAAPALVLDAGFVNVGTGTGAMLATISQSLTPGHYLLAAISNRNAGASATQPTVNCLNNNSNSMAGRHYFGEPVISDAATNSLMGIYAAITMGTWASYALPDPFPAWTMANTNGDVPIIGLRAA